MAVPQKASQRPVKTGPKPADPAKQKPAAAAAAKYAKAAALPDATLTDDEAPEGDGAEATGWLATWMAPGRRRWVLLGAAIGSLFVLVAVTMVATAFRDAPPRDESDVIAGPAQAIDGGTLIVAGQTLQLEDIDAPPASLMCRDGAYQYRCGDEARQALAVAIGTAPVECVHPHPRRGGQLAALCRNETGLDLAAIQVESGWAVNDLRASSRYIAEELRARTRGVGLWRNDFAHPELWRSATARR